MIAANITMTPILFNQTQIMGHYWTLETELVFYLFCWLLFIFGILKSPITLFAIPILLLSTKGILVHQAWFASIPGQWRTMPYHLAIMFWGALYRNWKNNPTKKISLPHDTPWLAIPLSVLLLALTAAILSPTILATYHLSLNGDETQARYASSYLLGISIFILGIHYTQIGTKHLAYLGKISYSIYLFHPTVFYTILWVIKKVSPPTLQQQHISFYITLTMITTIPISSLIYSTIEEPFIKLSHNLTKK